MALREVYARTRQHNDAAQAAHDLRAWTSWARRYRLEPFKMLAATIKARFEAVVRGMTDHRSNAFVEAMNGSFNRSSVPHAAGAPRAASSPIAYLRLSHLRNLPAHLFARGEAVR